MTITLTELAILLTGERGDLQKEFDLAEKDAKSWGSRLGGTITNVVGGAIAGAGVVAAGAIASIGVTAFDVSNDTREAANDIAASLGIPIEEAERFAEVAREVYGANFAGSVTEASDAVKLLAQQLGLTADGPELQRLTEKAFALSDVFDADVADSVDAAKALMNELGLSGDEAFDLIAAGYQRGLDSSGDFLDTIREYANQFGTAGFSAEQMFSIIESGSAAGVLGTDKISDAIKEMTIRLNEGGDEAAGAFDAIGLNFDQIAVEVSRGEATWADYFDEIVGGLNSIEDPIARSQAQVAIFGTQAEDLGVAFTEGLDPALVTLAELEGSADSLNVKYTGFGDFFSQLWRDMVLAVTPLTDLLLEMANQYAPQISVAFEVVENVLGRVADIIAGLVSGDLNGGIFAFTSDDPSIQALQTVQDVLQGVSDFILEEFAFVRDWFTENMPLIQEAVATVTGAITAFWEENGETILRIVTTAWESVKTIIDTVLQVILGLVKAALQILTGDWEGAFETLKEVAQVLMDGILEVLKNGLDILVDLFAVSLDLILDAVKAIVNSIIDAFLSIDWVQLGLDIVQGIADGIWAGASYVVDAAIGAAEAAYNATLDFLGIGSPSRLTRDEIGVPFVQGIEQGIGAEMQRLQLSVTSDLGRLFGQLDTGSGLTVNIAQQFSGAADPERVRDASRGGVLQAARLRGA